MRADTLILDIDWLVTVDGERRIIRDAGLAIVGGKFAAIGKSADVAREYLTRYLQFDIDEPQLEAIRAFHGMAAEEGIIPSPPKPLTVWRS